MICARQNKKEAVLKGIVERLENSATLGKVSICYFYSWLSSMFVISTELKTGIEEVKKICLLRLLGIIIHDKSQL